jgi:hypothetical protein
MAHYLVVSANEALFQFVGTQIGQTMFNGDGNLDGGGRIINCKALASPCVVGTFGYVLANQIYVLLVPQDEAEDLAIAEAQLTLIESFETAEDFLQKYVSA